MLAHTYSPFMGMIIVGVWIHWGHPSLKYLYMYHPHVSGEPVKPSARPHRSPSLGVTLLDSLPPLQPQQTRLGATCTLRTIAVLIIESIATFVQGINLQFAFGFIKSVLSQAVYVQAMRQPQDHASLKMRICRPCIAHLRESALVGSY
jgi:hypothetical protein